MKNLSQYKSGILVAGFAGPHGDDRVGWSVVAALGSRPCVPARLITVGEETQLIDEVEECNLLVAVDACRGGSRIGRISRLEWPDPRIRQYHNHSKYGIKLCNALQLMDRMGRMPEKVVVFGVDIGNRRPLGAPIAEVAQAVAELDQIIFSEICENIDARAVVG